MSVVAGGERAGAVPLSVYTDPIDPWSWALEPALRKLIHSFGEQLAVTYIMVGVLRDPGEPLREARAMLDAGHESGMPVDARVWLDGGPLSSHPLCIAVKAAAEQGDPARYLRRLREDFVCRRRGLQTAEALVEAARATPGIDPERFRIDLGSHAILEAFAADLDRAAAVGAEHHAPGTGRVKVPSLRFGDGPAVFGFADYETLRGAALAAGARPRAEGPPTIEEALRRFGPMATAEVAAVCELPGPRAPAELWRLACEWRIRPERVGSGELWTLA